MLGLGVIVLAGFVFCFSRCGSRAVAKKPPPMPVDKSGKPKRIWNDDCPEPKDWGREPVPPPPGRPAGMPPAKPVPPARPSSETDADGMPRARKPRKPAHPGNLADWKRDDYYSAKRENDPRLAAAIDCLGKRAGDKQAAAEVLGRLLEPPADARDSDRATRPLASDAKLAEAAIAALAANGTPAAWRIIRQVAVGQLETLDNRAAVIAAVKALLAWPSKENDGALFGVVTAAETKPAGQPPASDAQGLRKTCLALIGASASESLRLRLADHLAAPSAPQALYEEIWRSLQEPRWENLLAQISLYLSNRPEESSRALLEKRLLAGSSDTLARLLGVNPAQAASGPGAAGGDPNPVARRLWSPEFAAVVQRRLPAIDRFDDGAPLALLAGTIPSPGLRTALGHALEMHWSDGPKALELAGLGGRVLPEPGFLVVMKKVWRAEIAAKSASKSASRSAASRSARQQDSQLSSRWAALGERVTVAMCQRFREAGRTAANSGRSAPGGGSDAPDDDQDKLLQPHPNADVLASYRVEWPAGLDEQATGPAISPLCVRYLRTAQMAKPLTLLGYYRRQMPGARQRTVSGGVWLDGFSAASGDRARDRSVDVFITVPSKSAAAPANQPQRLIVDVLLVECEDGPAQKADAENE